MRGRTTAIRGGRVSNPDHFPALAHSADSRKAPVGDEEQVSRHGRRANAPRRATHDNHDPPKSVAAPKGAATATWGLRGSPPELAEWRCRESNPGPSVFCQGFSERSSLCLYSAPAIT